MSKLLDALRKKYKTSADAMKALGLDVALLKEEMTGDAKPSNLSRLKSMAADMRSKSARRRP
jgi:hypothetical protein